MSFSRPSLSDLISRNRSDVLSRLGIDDSLRRSDAEVYARVLSGAAHALYGYLEWMSRQIIYDSAEAEYLERWASIWGVTRKSAAAATGTISVTAETGSVIPAGSVFQALDAVQYAADSDVVITASPTAIFITAVEDGAAGNRTAGQTLSLVSPIAGVQPSATASELSGGADEETDDALRSRLISRIQSPPQGGSASDYVTWALKVSGVTRAWCYPLERGLGSVVVRFMRDDDSDPIPGATAVAAVQSYLDELRPATAALTVLAPVAAPLNFTLSVTPSTSKVKAAVEAELADLILREAEPGGAIPISHVRAAISAAAGEADYLLASPTADVSAATGKIITMGVVTWQ